MDSEPAVTVFLSRPAGHSLLSSIAARWAERVSSWRLLTGPLDCYERQFDIDTTRDPRERRQHGERRPVEQEMALEPQHAVLELGLPDVERHRGRRVAHD